MITKEQFLLRQPAAPDVTATDPFYYDLCCRLVNVAQEKRLFPSYPEKVMERAALCLIGYYQDVISDAGIWRAFINENRKLYGYTVPFYEDATDYVDYEMNLIDVRFIVWYALSMNYENRRVCYPLDDEILSGAKEWFDVLEKEYSEAPIPADYRMTGELEIKAHEDRDAILKLGTWLFMHCYLMTPAFALSLSEIASKVDFNKDDAMADFQRHLDEAMMKDPTGPLALYVGEWLYLIIEGDIPAQKNSPDPLTEHKYYTKFVKFTGGETIKFFKGYEELNNFFINALEWGEGEEHLPQLKSNDDFVLMVDPHKGMLVAVNIARCIKAPGNPYYDKDYARSHAIDLLTQRGCCPGDLLRFIFKEGWVPDAVFPASDDTAIVEKNWDFIARCYLQEYYRGD